MEVAAAPKGGFLGKILGRGDIFISSSVIMIMLIMIIPLPDGVMDFLLSLSVSLALITLLVAFYTLKPLEFAVFPGILLILTLFRLSLNIATTRLILTKGYAGELIYAFGNFVVQGNYVVGIIVFGILVIINFVVITKGATRIAEVTARFTLDAMPGKQMAIDADLGAGLLTDEEAKKRRDDIAREADFYGAMDGASKFVRGDAIAGLLITFINIVGGLVIGVLQRGMSMAEAAHTYTLLTVGDGLISQIPSLLISTAAGIIVTRAASESELSDDISGQMFGNPKVLAVGGIFLILMGLIPGMPIFPFWIIGGTMVFSSYKKQQKIEALEAEVIENQVVEEPAKERVEDYLLVDTLELEIGYSLIPIVDPEQDGDLLERMASLRKQLAVELGIIVPPIRIRDNVQLDANKYVIKLRGITIGDGELLPGYYLALLPGDSDIPLQGIKTKDPTFGLDAVWVSGKNKTEAEKYGLSVIESGAVITTHLMEVLKNNAYKLLDRDMVKKLIDNVKESAPAVVDELHEKMSIGDIQKVLRRLLRERVPVRDLISILETLADYQSQTKNTDVLTEYARASLSETITRQFRTEENELNVAVLDTALESHLISEAQKGNLNPNTLGFTPETVEKLYLGCSKVFQNMLNEGTDAVLMTSPVLRPTLYEFLVPILPEIHVLSYNDITMDTQIKTVDRISLN
ncbi:MAG TPA: flagellar biosynthesis protein FlhA [Balneolales bacterium]|nr:flagellar biosynthesis protein FlhA [Balneolales bacterium]